MRSHFLWARTILLIGLFLMFVLNPGESRAGRNVMTEQHKITDEKDAVSVAKELTGFGALSGTVITARHVRVENDDTPFLAKGLIGTTAWEVKFDHVVLSLKSALPGFKDASVRMFIALIRADTGQLWSVKSFVSENVPDLRREPSADVAEAQMRPEKDIYTALPSENPHITFIDALDIILTRGSGSPFTAKEIHAVYVMESDMGSEVRPVWAITLRGIPPIPVSGPGAAKIPKWQLNRMRNVINAKTGDFLFATNSPQPEV